MPLAAEEEGEGVKPPPEPASTGGAVGSGQQQQPSTKSTRELAFEAAQRRLQLQKDKDKRGKQ